MGVYIGLIDDLNHLRDLSRRDRSIEVVSNDYFNSEGIRVGLVRYNISLPYIELLDNISTCEESVWFSNRRNLRDVVTEAYSRQKGKDVRLLLLEDKMIKNKKPKMDSLIDCDYVPVAKVSEKFVEDAIVSLGTRFDSFL